MTPRDFVGTPPRAGSPVGLIEWGARRAELVASADPGGSAGARPERDPTPRQTIALCMMVRNDAPAIEACLASVSALVDSWVVCDVGSADDTPERVATALRHLPGELHRRRWRNSAANRSQLMRLAAGSADYLLLIDTDMTLRLDAPLPELTCDAYFLRQDDRRDHPVPRLVRGDRKWWFDGSTHGHLTTEGPYTRGRLDALVVERHADETARAEQQRRDVRRLERDVSRRPDDVRAVFYLAQTYRDMGQDRRAIELYQRRAALGGWDEEVFYATYQAGALLAKYDLDAATATLLDASQKRPQRAEALHELVRLLRYQGQYEAAHLHAQRAAELPCPPDLLFVHRWIYEWGARFELAITAYWVGDTALALTLNRQLLAEGRLPPDIHAAASQNLTYCTATANEASEAEPAPPETAEAEYEGTGSALPAPTRRDRPSLSELCPSFAHRALELDVPPAWSQFNPTIAADGLGFRLIVRAANYRLVGGRYQILDDEGVIRTINYAVTLDRQLEIVAASPLVDASDGPPTYPSRITGYEDCRLVRVGDVWVATATVRDRNPVERADMVLLTLDADVITEVTILKSPSPGRRHEKNWMPFSLGGELYVLYRCDPTTVLRLDRSNGAPQAVAETPGPRGAASLRGGSQGVHVRDGLLFVVHEAEDLGGRRSYGHRFVLLDRDHRIAGCSPPFHLTGEDVEFCAGLAQRDGDLLLTFGVGDQSAALGVIDANEVLGVLDDCRA